MQTHRLRPIHIVGNTSSSTEAFARRTTEIARFVSGLGRQGDVLERTVAAGRDKRLTLIRTHPTLSETICDGRIVRSIISLTDTLRMSDPNGIYRQAKTLDDLKLAFDPLVSSMEGIVKDADVVLLGGTYFVPWALLQAARRQHKPVVLCYAGILSMEIRHLPEEMQSALRVMEKDFYDPSIHYVFPSALTRSTVEGIFGHNLPKSEVIFNGIPPEFFDVRPAETKEVAVAYVGRNTPVKNPEFLLGLARAFQRRGAPHSIHMVTAADPKNNLIIDLLRAGVVVHAPMDTDELARFYGSTSVVLSPSRFETFGNVPLEAVSAGTPALVSPSMGVGEVFSEIGLSSFITSFADPDAIADRVIEFVRTHATVPSKVRSRLRDEFSWPTVIGKYIDLCAQSAASGIAQ